MQVEPIPSYTLNKKDLSLKEFKMYVYCGEYYREYFDKKDIPLYESFTSFYTLYYYLVTFILSYYSDNKVWPSDVNILTKFNIFNQIAMETEQGIYWPNKKNDFYLSLISLRSEFLKISNKITKIFPERKVQLDSISVSVKLLLSTNRYDFILVDNSDPLSYIDIWLSHISSGKRLIVIYFNPVSYDFKMEEFHLTDQASRDIRQKLKSFSRGILNNVYLPISGCKNACPHRNLCNRVGSWNTTYS